MMSKQGLKIDTEAEQSLFEEMLAGAIDATVESIKKTRERLNGYQSLTVSSLWHGWCWRAAKAMQDEAAALHERVMRKAAEDERDRYKHLLFERSESSGGWVPVTDGLPDLSEDVLVTLLIDGTDSDWKAGYWDGQHWYMLDTEHDEPIQVNAGCNFVVTHWARIVPAGMA